MPEDHSSTRSAKPPKPSKPAKVTLKALADHLGLSPTTISRVLNRSRGSQAIPAETQARIIDAARELNYRPNQLARSLRQRRSFSIGVIAPEISDVYTGAVVGGIDSRLLASGYFYFLTCHQSRDDLLDRYLNLLTERSVEGFLVVNAMSVKAPNSDRVMTPAWPMMPS